MSKATKTDLANALGQLSHYLPNENFALENYGQRYRIIREDFSRPFGSNYYPKDILYDMIWAMVEVLRLAGIERSK